jgi:hypothetical protein
MSALPVPALASIPEEPSMSVPSCPMYAGPLHPSYVFDPDCQCRGTGDHVGEDYACGLWMIDPQEPDARQLADMLRLHATGAPRQEAATGLLIGHGHWLLSRRFRSFVDVFLGRDPVTLTTAPLAYVQWPQVAAALERGELYGSGSELAVLRIAGSLADPTLSVTLADALTSLDVTNTRLVLTAITHATSTGRGWSA